MKALNKTLVLGPYDWDPSLVPLAEFQARLAASRRVLAEHGANALLVHGDTLDHGALTYLTGFTPKLGPALAVVPLEGNPQLLFSGGGGMAESCRRLTWVENLRPFGGPQSLAASLLPIAPENKLVLAVWGGAAMDLGLHSATLAAASPLGRVVELQDQLEGLRRRKSEREQGLLRRAGEVLGATIDRLRKEAEVGVRAAVLAAEGHAYSLGAQDVRILASARSGGPPLAGDPSEDLRVDPLNVSVAVRYAGYWAEAHMTLSANGSSLLRDAETGLAAILNVARAGASGKELRRFANRKLCASGAGIGLSLEEAPYLFSKDTTLAEGDVCSLAVGAVETVANVESRAIVSALFTVRASGVDVLWSGL